MQTRRTIVAAGLASLALASPLAAEPPGRLTLDWAYYNPVSLVLKEKGWIEREFEKDGIAVRWVQSHDSNKALEFLNAGAIDFGSSAGAAALLFKAWWGPMTHYGVIHGDPHLGNYALTENAERRLAERAKLPDVTIERVHPKDLDRRLGALVFLVRGREENRAAIGREVTAGATAFACADERLRRAVGFHSEDLLVRVAGLATLIG